MVRLGEHLAAARLLDQEQIDRALRAQVLWGGRLGTNLIELGLLDLDRISRALGRQHRVPAALSHHFENADRELQERLLPELAKQWSVVPLRHVGPKKQIAIAVLDPLPAEALAELADAFLCGPENILVTVAAEMRVRYHLERVYAIKRPARFLRTKGPTITPFPQFENVPVPVDSDVEVAVPIAVDDSAHPTGRASAEDFAVPPDIERATSGVPQDIARATTAVMEAPPPATVDDSDALMQLIDDAVAQAMAVEPPEPPVAGRDRRSYVRTLADAPPGPQTPAPASVVTGAALARMSIKRMAVSEAKPAAQTFVDGVRAIKRAGNRDRVAELVIETLQRFVPACEAAVLLVIRGEVATSWGQFSRASTTSPEIAVPLDQPGLLPGVIANNAVARSGFADLTAIDEALMRSLGEPLGDLVVLPIAIADQVMALIAASTDAGAPIGGIESVAFAAGAAFARLIRDASR